MAGGAPFGNNNAGKNKQWTAAIERALKKRSLMEKRNALDDLAETFLKECDKAEGWALKELGDRLEGKANQSIAVTNENPQNPSRDLADSELAGIITENSGSRAIGKTNGKKELRGIH